MPKLLSYQAMEQIYLGQVADGLETIRCVYDRVWADGNAWSAGLRGNGESIYMTHPVIWAVLNALTGAALDVPNATLHVSPRVGGEIERLSCPMFFPSFWALLEYTPNGGATTIEVLRTFGAPVTLARVVYRTVRGDVRTFDVGRTDLVKGTKLTLANF